MCHHYIWSSNIFTMDTSEFNCIELKIGLNLEFTPCVIIIYGPAIPLLTRFSEFNCIELNIGLNLEFSQGLHK